jgi:hypothetical protein
MKIIQTLIIVICLTICLVNAVYGQGEDGYGKRVYGLRGSGTAQTYFNGAQSHINSPDDEPKYIPPENKDIVVGSRGSQLSTIGAGSGNPESQKQEKPIRGSW